MVVIFNGNANATSRSFTLWSAGNLMSGGKGQEQDHLVLQMEQTPREHPGPSRPAPAAAAAQDRADHPPPGCCGLSRHLQVRL